MSNSKMNHAEIKRIMKEKGIRLTPLSVKMGMSRQMLHYILNSGSLKYVTMVAEALGVSVAEIITPTPLRLPAGYGIVDNKVRITRP